MQYCMHTLSLSHTGVDTHTYTHKHTHTHVQLGCFSKGCLCKGSWILKLAAYFTFMKVGNGPTADMITPRSKQEKALTFSYGSHYPFSTSLSLSIYLYLFYYHPCPPPSFSDFLSIVLVISLLSSFFSVSHMLFVFMSVCCNPHLLLLW